MFDLYENITHTKYEQCRNLIITGITMTRKRNKTTENDADVDMTPMLDIVFILLIFFIVTTSFIKEQGFLVNKPESNKVNSSNNPIVVINIDENGLVHMNNRIIDIERLPANIENYLSKNKTNTAVLIPHKNTNYEKVVAVLDQIQLINQLSISIGS